MHCFFSTVVVVAVVDLARFSNGKQTATTKTTKYMRTICIKRMQVKHTYYGKFMCRSHSIVCVCGVEKNEMIKIMLSVERENARKAKEIGGGER